MPMASDQNVLPLIITSLLYIKTTFPYTHIHTSAFLSCLYSLSCCMTRRGGVMVHMKTVRVPTRMKRAC